MGTVLSIKWSFSQGHQWVSSFNNFLMMYCLEKMFHSKQWSDGLMEIIIILEAFYIIP